MNKKRTIITIITSLFLTIFIIIFAVKLTLNFKQIYYFDVDYLNIPKITQLEKKDIIANYDALIDYFQTTNRSELKFPTFPMSVEGKIHFEDVKNIFVNLDYLMIFSLIIAVIGIYFLHKNKHYIYLRYTSILLFLLPLILIFFIGIDFNRVFTIFHKLFFRNDYWMFDSETDPIINILPETFFMHAALLILIIITICALLLNFLYRHFLFKYIKTIN